MTATISPITPEQVIEVIDAVPYEWPTLVEVACILKVSGRSVRRHLRHCGTSYHDLLIQTRLKLIEFLITETTVPYSDIAILSGYQCVTNLRKAFRNNQGRSVSTFVLENGIVHRYSKGKYRDSIKNEAPTITSDTRHPNG